MTVMMAKMHLMESRVHPENPARMDLLDLLVSYTYRFT